MRVNFFWIFLGAIQCAQRILARMHYDLLNRELDRLEMKWKDSVIRSDEQKRRRKSKAKDDVDEQSIAKSQDKASTSTP